MTEHTIVRRRRGLLALVAALALLAAAVAPGAAAADDEPPEPPPVVPAPEVQPGFEQFEDCPAVDVDAIVLCLAITVNGTVDIGGVSGDIEDLTLQMAAVADLFGGDSIIVPAEDGDGPETMPLPGGLLGIQELDPLLELDPVGLLTLGATPTMGDLEQQGLDDVIIMGILGTFDEEPVDLPPEGEEFCSVLGCAPYPELEMALPLNVRLHNLLLGDECTIGPVDLELTTGETDPPEGVEPLTGASGTAQSIDGITTVDGMEFVGNTYAVPGADCGGIAGLGSTLEDLTAGAVDNPFQTLIDGQAGLPSGAGQNEARLTVDLAFTPQDQVYAQVLPDVLGELDFGEVVVGEPQTQTVTYANNGHTPAGVTSTTVNPSTAPFTITTDGCSDTELAPGESCEVEITYEPTEPGESSARFLWQHDGIGGNPLFDLTGEGVAG